MKLPAISNRARQLERDVRRAKLPQPPSSSNAVLKFASTDELLELKAAIKTGDEATLERVMAMLRERQRGGSPPHPDTRDSWRVDVERGASALPEQERLSVGDVERAQRRAEAPSRFLSDGRGVEVELAFDPSPDADVPECTQANVEPVEIGATGSTETPRGEAAKVPAFPPSGAGKPNRVRAGLRRVKEAVADHAAMEPEPELVRHLDAMSPDGYRLAPKPKPVKPRPQVPKSWREDDVHPLSFRASQRTNTGPVNAEEIRDYTF